MRVGVRALSTKSRVLQLGAFRLGKKQQTPSRGIAFKLLHLLSFVVVSLAITIASLCEAHAQQVSTSPTPCLRPNWEDILGYQPFNSQDVNGHFVVFWASHVVTQALSLTSIKGGNEQEARNTILAKAFTDEGRQSFQEVFQKLGHDRVFEGTDATSLSTILATPASKVVIKGIRRLADKDKDGALDGTIWNVHGEYLLSYSLTKKDQRQKIYGEEFGRQVEIMINVLRPQNEDRLYIMGSQLLTVRDTK